MQGFEGRDLMTVVGINPRAFEVFFEGVLDKMCCIPRRGRGRRPVPGPVKAIRNCLVLSPLYHRANGSPKMRPVPRSNMDELLNMR